MKIKTTELTGAALNWAVAKSKNEDVVAVVNEGVPQVGFRCDARFIGGKPIGLFGNPVEYGWSAVGPIIARERITLQPHLDGWVALLPRSRAYGAEPLIAAMRCFVAAKLGEEVDVPDELLASLSPAACPAARRPRI
jgi:hypothetical protein